VELCNYPCAELNAFVQEPVNVYCTGVIFGKMHLKFHNEKRNQLIFCLFRTTSVIRFNQHAKFIIRDKLTNITSSVHIKKEVNTSHGSLDKYKYPV